MLLAQYIELQKFRRYVPDWITAFALTAYFILIAENATPFLRQFKLSDPKIQHPFAINERVSGPMCLVLASVLPLAAMALVLYYRSKDHPWHLLNVSILGLLLSISIDGVLTDILKAWIGQPRPDFLARCGPALHTPTDIFVDISVCTAPLGARLLEDGMRSCPSGHSSISFAAFGYLSLWLFGQWRLGALIPNKPLYMYLTALSPLALATYIALSRVQDYRHSFLDIMLGSGLGAVVAVIINRNYFQNFWSSTGNELLESENEPILPI